MPPRRGHSSLTTVVLVLLAGASIMVQHSHASDGAERFRSCYRKLMSGIPAQYLPASISSAPDVPESMAVAFAASATPDLIEGLCTAADKQVTATGAAAMAAAKTKDIVAMAATAAAAARSSDEGEVRAAVAADGDSVFDNAYQRDQMSKLYKQHPAEYNTGATAYKVMYRGLEQQSIVPSDQDIADLLVGYDPLGLFTPSGSIRPSASGYGLMITLCGPLKQAPSLAELVCKKFNTDPESIARGICNGVVLGLKIAYQICVWNWQISDDVVDPSINAAEIEASFENGKKVMNNQEILWDKTHDETNAFSALMKKRFTSMLQRQCKLENDVAALQREVNYLRKLLLTPDTLKPGFACWSARTAAVNFNQTSCTVPCTMTPPSGCTSASLQNALVVPAAAPSTTLSCTAANAR